MSTEKEKSMNRYYYSVKKGNFKNFQIKEAFRPLKKKYKGFKFYNNDDIISIEVPLPFRIVEKRQQQNIIIEKEYKAIQNELRRKIANITSSFIAVVEPSYIQVAFKDLGKIEEICKSIFEFGQKQTQKYGVYTKKGRLLTNYFV